MSESYMEELVAAWLCNRRRNAQEQAVIALIQHADVKFRHDDGLREQTGKALQKDFYRVAIAEKLAEADGLALTSRQQLLARADEILDKSHYRLGRNGKPKSMRTSEEQAYHNAVRTRWCILLKKAGVRAFDSRGGDTSGTRRRSRPLN